MALKKVLSKLSEISLKSKVGLGVTAALVGLLSWSVASNYFAEQEEPTRRPPPTASKDTSKSDDDEQSDADKTSGDGKAADDPTRPPQNGMGLAANSKLVNSFSQGETQTGAGDANSVAGTSTTTNSIGGTSGERYPTSSGTGNPGDRYADYGQNNAFGAETPVAGGQTADNDTTSGLGGAAGGGSLLEKYGSRDNASNDFGTQSGTDPHGDYRNATSGETGADTSGLAGAAGSQSSGSSANHDPFASSRASNTGSTTANTGSTTANDGTTPGYASGSPLPQLDRSTPTLDRDAPASGVGAPRAFDGSNVAGGAAAFRSGGDAWSNGGAASGAASNSNFTTNAFGQPTNQRGNLGGNQATGRNADPGQSLYPRYPSASVSAENTVSAGGNRRMTPINSTRPPEAQQQVASAGFDHPNPPVAASLHAQPTQPDQEFVAGHEDSFWTIAKQAYGEGGFYEALHAYNSQSIAKIDGLRVGDVVRAPARATLRKLFPEKCPAEPAERSATPAGSGNAVPAGRQRAESDAATENRSAVAADSAGTDSVRQVGGVADDVATTTYVTKKGEDLFQIAREQLGSAARWDEIYRLNSDVLGDNLDALSAGTRLLLPQATVTAVSGGRAN